MYKSYLLNSASDSKVCFKFYKMHGLGNDFVIIDQREYEFVINPEMVIKICDRNFGIGCDQLIVLRRSESFTCQMLIFNPDGSIARACGNACRCVGKLFYMNESLSKVAIQVHDRVVTVTKNEVESISEEDFACESYRVEIGKPYTEWYNIPLSNNITSMPIKFDDPYKFEGYAVNVGNPHLIFIADPTKNQREEGRREPKGRSQKSIRSDFLHPMTDDEILEYGAYFENHKLFPERVNVNFAHIVAPNRIHLKVFERGTGPTLACGSGACATHYIAHSLGLVEGKAEVVQAGGSLTIEYKDGLIYMSGPAELSFVGEFSL